MLHILLLILKIIGIILLCVLGVLLLGIVCVLFVPVRYRVEVVRREGEGEPPVIVQAKITWLLHLFNLLARFTGTFYLRARIFIITVFRLPKKEKRGRKKPETAQKEAGKGEKDRESGTGGADGTQEADDGTRGQLGEEIKAAKAAREGNDEIKTSATARVPGDEIKTSAAARKPGDETEASETARKPADRKEAPGAKTDAEEGQGVEAAEAPGEPGKKPFLSDRLRILSEKIRGFFKKIRELFENIQYTIQNFCDKIKSVSDTIEYYRGVVAGEAFQRSFALCKGELLKVCRALKPQKLEVSLIVGMDDPAATGEILAVCGMLYPLLGGHVDVSGDFEKKRLEGRVFVKGKLRFFTFLRVAGKLYFNKDIKTLYKLLKKEAV